MSSLNIHLLYGPTYSSAHLPSYLSTYLTPILKYYLIPYSIQLPLPPSHRDVG